MTDHELEQRLRALAHETRAQGEPDMQALILGALRDERARLMRERRRAHWALAGTLMLALMGGALALLPGGGAPPAASLHVAKGKVNIAPQQDGVRVIKLSDLGTACSQGIALEPAGGSADAEPTYYTLTLHSIAL